MAMDRKTSQPLETETEVLVSVRLYVIQVPKLLEEDIISDKELEELRQELAKNRSILLGFEKHVSALRECENALEAIQKTQHLRKKHHDDCKRTSSSVSIPTYPLQTRQSSHKTLRRESDGSDEVDKTTNSLQRSPQIQSPPRRQSDTDSSSKGSPSFSSKSSEKTPRLFTFLDVLFGSDSPNPSPTKQASSVSTPSTFSTSQSTLFNDSRSFSKISKDSLEEISEPLCKVGERSISVVREGSGELRTPLRRISRESPGESSDHYRESALSCRTRSGERTSFLSSTPRALLKSENVQEGISVFRFSDLSRGKETSKTRTPQSMKPIVEGSSTTLSPGSQDSEDDSLGKFHLPKTATSSQRDLKLRNSVLGNDIGDGKKRVAPFTIKDWVTFSKQKKLERIIKGLPDMIRGPIWHLLSGGQHCQGLSQIRTAYKIAFKTDSKYHTEIVQDLPLITPQKLPRQYEHKQKMVRILDTYANLNQEVGYRRPLGYLAGVLAIYMQEEDAVFTLYAILHRKSGLSVLYKKDSPQLQEALFLLQEVLKELCPSLYKFFNKHGISSADYAKDWFLTLLSQPKNIYSEGTLDSKVILRLWDLFFLEGFIAIFKACVFILKSNEEAILAQKTREEALKLLPNLERFSGEPASLLKEILKVQISRESVAALSKSRSVTTSQMAELFVEP